ncbi:putative 2-(5''-triphosphoribosyl)-3'-dephosphocoenzyme-A synthase [Lacrimispora amygdalina]|uniref:Probable 2-(5''-triphosphoribosyl)-3'-dephosphocoenzyme-A synthase n=1 Tax=Lacrimispora amygdalina TaxID=253257 RepID=A0ABQ5M086_9FIRM
MIETDKKKWENYTVWLGNMAGLALLEEVDTAPKPGLVDSLSNGAHRDMNLLTFQRSADALIPYFWKFAETGIQMSEKPEGCFLKIRQIGIQAEEAMYEATGQINTHKGAVFTMGILCAAAGICYKKYGQVSISRLIVQEQKMVKNILLNELDLIQIQNSGDTHGKKNLCTYGSRGIRGEAADGYPSVINLALPVIRQGKKEGRNWNLVKIQALFTLMSQVEDGNILSRCKSEGLKEVQKLSKEFLLSGGAYSKGAIEELTKLDTYFIHKNYSSGGCADLLAAAIFLSEIEEAWAGK